MSCAPPGPGHGPCPSQHSLQGEGPVQLGCRGGVGRVSLRHLCGMRRLNSRPVSSLGCRSTSSERPRVGRRAPAAVASGVSAIARCTECGPARWWCNSTAPRREDATSWRLCCLGPWRVLRAPLRGCQYPRRRPGAEPGPRTPCSEPLRRKWRRMAPFTADSTSWCRRAPACAALHPLPASGRMHAAPRP